ncbi:MAG: hypothetical protein ACI89L_001228 [Phycisphaerales bacterium]|jgi:hypothetical protein
MTRDATRLSDLMRAGHAAILIQTIDEPEARQAAFAAADSFGAHVWTWTTIDGLRDHSNQGGGPISDTEPAAGALFWLSQRTVPSVQVFFDLSDHLGDPKALRALRRLIQFNADRGGHLILIDHNIPQARVIVESCTPFSLSMPSDEEIEAEVRSALQAQHAVGPIEVNLTKGQFRVFLKNLRGLSRRHIRQIVREIVGDKQFDSEDLNHAIAIKRELLSAGGVLEFVESPATLDGIGGLTHLKAWLAQRSESFDEKAEKYGIAPPRGVLLLGVQGAGKSLSAKAVATGWNRPLLRLDPSSLYDRFVGESERRLRDALTQAEAMSPIVLWIDEIEKGFASAASQSTDGGLSQRMFGTLLTWMQDHTAPVFLIATANNIDALPPELLRKGRFDEIFFVDLPDAEARRMIFAIHLKKRSRDPEKFDLDTLTDAADGFSGAEIEQAVIAGLHTAFSEKRELTTEDVLKCVRTSPPLSVTMAEKVAKLRAWAKERCVPAG